MTKNWTKLVIKAVEKVPKSDESIGSGLSENTELMSEKNKRMLNLREREFSKKRDISR